MEKFLKYRGLKNRESQTIYPFLKNRPKTVVHKYRDDNSNNRG